MVCQELSFHSIKPFVRFAQDIYLTAEQPPKTVKAYDHRLFYIVSGTALLEINNITKEISPGHVLYWMSGAPYIFNVCSNHALHMISINFDFTQNNCQTVQYLPMVLHTDYDEHKQLESIAFTDATVLNNPIILNDLPGILPYMQNIVSEAASPALFSDFHLSNLLSVILCDLYRAASQRQMAKGKASSYKQIVEYISSHYAENIDNRFLADKFGYHPKYISQLITQHTGTSIHQYLLKVRIRNAVYLLQTTQLPISEIAHRVGFHNTSYFSEYFRRSTGYSPSSFRIE